MNKMMWTFVVAGSLLTAPAIAGASQQGQSQATTVTPPASEGADMTTATYGDWQLRCRQNEPGKPERTCEVVQTVVVQGQTAPFAQIAFGRLATGGPLYFTAVVPPNVTFPGALKVALDEKDGEPVAATWTRCLPGGCFASMAMSDEVLARWRAKDEGGRISFQNGAGQDVAVPISFRGLGRALDALAKEK